jgi:hypothetical protein
MLQIGTLDGPANTGEFLKMEAGGGSVHPNSFFAFAAQ